MIASPAASASQRSGAALPETDPLAGEPFDPMAGILHLAAWRARAEHNGLSADEMRAIFPAAVAERLNLGADALEQMPPLEELSAGLEALGYAVESGKAKAQKIARPVLFGENGVAEVSYEIDAFHDGEGIAVEVEAGRGAANNADYRDIVRTALILDARYLALLTPISYRTTTTISAYSKTRNQLEAIYASDRLKLPFLGVLLVGY